MSNRELFRQFMWGTCSPRHFLDWNYYFAISSILARKVWLFEDSKIFPNLYIIFTGKPSVGKSWPAELTRQHLESIVEFSSKKDTEDNESITEKSLVNLAPQSLSVERLYEICEASVESRLVQDKPKKFYMHSSLTFYHTEELTTLFQKNQETLVDFFVQGWNGGSFKRETKQNGKVNITNMCLNLCSCTTPNRLADCLASKLMTEGFTSRCIFIHGEEPFHRQPVFKPTAEEREGLKRVKEHWKQVGKCFGEVKLTQGAVDWLHDWIKNGMDNVGNKDKKLEDYYGRKYHHLTKMAMVTHFAESTTMELTEADFILALKELELVEKHMHKSLKSMGANPLHKIAEDIKNYLKQRGDSSWKTIVAEFFDGGNHEDINQALGHLELVEEIKSFSNDLSPRMYKLISKDK